MKKQTTGFDDGLEWLREIRRRMMDRCDNDLDKLVDYYRQFETKYPVKTGVAPAVLRDKKK